MLEFGLPEQTIEQLRNFFACYPEIEQVKVYGSRAKGNYEKGSDIDMAFYAQTDKMLEGHLLTELDELSTPYLFNVTDYYKITHQPLKEHIDRVGKTLYENKKE